jgi:hypothetical protein
MRNFIDIVLCVKMADLLQRELEQLSLFLLLEKFFHLLALLDLIIEVVMPLYDLGYF